MHVGAYVYKCAWHYGAVQQCRCKVAAVPGPGCLSRQLSYLAALGIYRPGVTWWASQETVGLAEGWSFLGVVEAC